MSAERLGSTATLEELLACCGSLCIFMLHISGELLRWRSTVGGLRFPEYPLGPIRSGSGNLSRDFL